MLSAPQTLPRCMVSGLQRRLAVASAWPCNLEATSQARVWWHPQEGHVHQCRCCASHPPVVERNLRYEVVQSSAVESVRVVLLLLSAHAKYQTTSRATGQERPVFSRYWCSSNVGKVGTKAFALIASGKTGRPRWGKAVLTVGKLPQL